MKYVTLILVVTVTFSCKQRIDNKRSQNETVSSLTPLLLPVELEHRRVEFQNSIDAAKENIKSFAAKYTWSKLTENEFVDSVMIFDNKDKFDFTLLKLITADTLLEIPETYCAALENRVLISVTPEYYSKVYPEGIEEKSFEKLLTHEIAHRLHIRILNGNEEAMGPIWFYEGFAIYVADQFSKSDLTLSKNEIIDVMKNPERGSYLKYNYIFRYFVKRIPLDELIRSAKGENFNDELIQRLQSYGLN
jgi:hypothetical protein